MASPIPVHALTAPVTRAAYRVQQASLRYPMLALQGALRMAKVLTARRPECRAAVAPTTVSTA